MTTEEYQKEMAKNIEQNTLGPNDTFQFTCRECGACCRNRTTPIMLTGLDIYRMAKGLNIDAYEAFARCPMPTGKSRNWTQTANG